MPKRAQQVIQRLEYKNIDMKVSEVSAGEFARIASIDEPNDSLICSLYHRIKDKEFTICWVDRPELTQFLKLIDEIRNVTD